MLFRSKLLPMDGENRTNSTAADGNLISLEGGSDVVDSSNGKVIGSVRVFDPEAGQGLALLRLKEAHEAMEGKKLLKIGGSGGVDGEIRPWRPEWWPETWGREER